MLASFGRTAAIITIGDEVVEARIANENASWLCGELMHLAIWPRLVIAVPDDEDLIVRLLRIAFDTTDVIIVCGGLGFTPDDVTKRAVARACMRTLEVDLQMANELSASCAWATAQIVEQMATFPSDSSPVRSTCGGVPGFSIGQLYVLPGSPMEMREMFPSLGLTSPGGQIVTSRIACKSAEHEIHDVLVEFDRAHQEVRLGSYATYDARGPSVGIVLASRSQRALSRAETWLAHELASYEVQYPLASNS